MRGRVEKSPLEAPIESESTPDWAAHCRPATPKDLEYIRSTWLSSYRTSPYAGVVPNNLFDDVYGETITQLILRGMRFVVVANPADPSLLLGWLAYEVSHAPPPYRDEYVVHYLFVKPAYRRLGVASQALASVGIAGPFFYTFRTSNSKFLKGGVFRPEIARRKAFGPGSTGGKAPVH